MKVNLGCGSIQPDGWVNVDWSPCGPGVVFGDMTARLPFTEGSVDAVVAHHSLQQIRVEDLPAAFAEIRRILRPGGVLRITVPDIRAAISAWQCADHGWFPNHRDGQHIDETACAYLTWFGTNVTPLTDQVLVRLLVDAGFSEACIAVPEHTVLGPDWICDLDDRAGESIFMEAAK